MKYAKILALVAITGSACGQVDQNESQLENSQNSQKVTTTLEFARKDLSQSRSGVIVERLAVINNAKVRLTECDEEQRCRTAGERNLKRSEVKSIESLIAQASEGEVQYPDPTQIRCLAMPSEAVAYTANNATLILFAATRPCGGATTNSSPAASTLVRMMDHWRGELGQ
jgi:hypothetical protein